MLEITRPQADECAPYYHRYINQVSGENALATLESTALSTPEFFKTIPAEKWDFRYAPGKWSLKESILHMIDTERIFSYRALRIARNDQTPIEGFEQDDYIPYYQADQRTAESIIEEYQAVRAATLHLFRNLDQAALLRRGTASGQSVSVRALAYMLAGHEQHHLKLTRERYLAG